MKRNLCSYLFLGFLFGSVIGILIRYNRQQKEARQAIPPTIKSPPVTPPRLPVRNKELPEWYWN